VPSSFEQYLQDCFQEETRLITLPDNSKSASRRSNIAGTSIDFLLIYGSYNDGVLERMALFASQASCRSFEVEFIALVGIAHLNLTKHLGFDLF
jgi:hypothetical protein